ncbi:MAG: pilus assembly protein PilP [Nitrospinae bacterium]|nr:pilus assembly protein PilP [Nitrospinota bacterium]
MKRNKIRFTFITIIIVILSGVNLILFSISVGEESDYSYNPTGKRDPFKSFLFDIGFSREGFRRLSEEELQNLKIDLITYEYIKKNDPNMYKEISRYERFFKDLDAFKELTAEERRSEIEKYKELRIDANSKYKDVVFRHPLTKIGLSSLKMVGIILGGLGNSALIETEDSRGYTIKKGMALGLNNGIVTDINSNGLIVEERYVDYLGNVIAEIIDIKLQREEG